MLNNNVFNLPITCQTVCQSSCNLCLVNFSSFFHLFKNFSGAFSMNLLRDVFKPVMALKSALFHGICPARFTSSLKLLFLPGPGLGAPLSSYLEVALYKFHR